MDHDDLVNKRVTAIARACDCTIGQVNAGWSIARTIAAAIR
jgi:hypothetical protein